MVTTRSSLVEVGDAGRRLSESSYRLEWYSSDPRVWPVVNTWVWSQVGEVHIEHWVMIVMALSSPYWQWCYWGDIGHGVMPLLSHADDSAAETTWLWRDTATKSYRDDDTVETTWPCLSCWTPSCNKLDHATAAGGVPACWIQLVHARNQCDTMISWVSKPDWFKNEYNNGNWVR
jgi:hypothetical protein